MLNTITVCIRFCLRFASQFLVLIQAGHISVANTAPVACIWKQVIMAVHVTLVAGFNFELSPAFLARVFLTLLVNCDFMMIVTTPTFIKFSTVPALKHRRYLLWQFSSFRQNLCVFIGQFWINSGYAFHVNAIFQGR